MCGIAGVLEDEATGGADTHTVATMLSAIHHRGPDEEGVFSEGPVGLGIRRLSIIDLEGGQQPITNEDGTVVVVFNGEIYNYASLRQRLSSSGHTLRTNSDTEVLVHLYEELGDDLVHELQGMFAFALWDSRRQRLLVARDRLGIKPLYWTEDSGRLLFASEIKALLMHPGLSPELNYDGLAEFMTLRYVPAPATMFKGIDALLPGHLLTCEGGRTKVRRWWSLSFAQDEALSSEQEATAQLKVLLDDAVQAQMVSDVPYGAFLSGGVDSSTLVAIMSRHSGKPISTFSVGYKDSGAAESELKYARLVADRYETDHHEVFVAADDFNDLAERTVWHLDQPLADQACVPNFMVSRLAREHVKMVLTGEGGDELFAGYPRYVAESRVAPVSTRLPASLRTAAMGLSQRRPGMTLPKVAAYALSQRDEATRIAMYTPLMHPEIRAELAAGSSLAEAVSRSSPGELFAADLRRTDATGRINRMLYVDTQHWLPDYLLLRGDKTSMAASLEARVPLLDHRLVEFAAGVPASLKLRGGLRPTGKYLLRQVARELLPAPILSRSKKGFPVPLSSWLRGGSRDFCHDMLSPDTIKRRGLFSPQLVDTVLRQHDSGEADHGSLLWALMSVELWHRLYLDADGELNALKAKSS